MTGRRAAARAETTATIIRLARQQIEERGAANISLREIARDLGMASSAVYRYFESRDQLLTVLIVETYDQLGAAVESADAGCRRDDLPGRWNAIAMAIRAWALDHRSDYGLVFGTPVPGYSAPEDTVVPALRYTNVLVRLLADAHAAGHRTTLHAPATKGLTREYRHVRRSIGLEVPDSMLLAGLAAWSSISGAISLEIFGHVDTVFASPGVHYSALVDMLGRQLMGLG